MTKRAKILTVEDQRIVARDMVEIITGLGHTSVGTATNADDAIWLMKVEEPDLVLLDIAIDGERDGISLARMIREEFDTAIVFVSSHADKQTLERAATVHPNGYLVKPFTQDRVDAAIVAGLANYRPAHSNLDMVRINQTFANEGLSAHALEQTEAYIDNHLDEKITIENMAEACGVAATAFPKRFKKATGQSPYQFVLIKRIHEAKRMLRHTPSPISDVALCVGFSNQAHFSTAFRKVVGVTPGQYRRV